MKYIWFFGRGLRSDILFDLAWTIRQVYSSCHQRVSMWTFLRCDHLRFRGKLDNLWLLQWLVLLLSHILACLLPIIQSVLPFICFLKLHFIFNLRHLRLVAAQSWSDLELGGWGFRCGRRVGLIIINTEAFCVDPTSIIKSLELLLYSNTKNWKISTKVVLRQVQIFRKRENWVIKA